MTLAQTFAGAVPVAFGAGSDDVYADMLAALLSGEVDAVVDDDVVFVPLGATHPDYELAFTVQTANKWGSRCRRTIPTSWPRSTLRSVDLIESGALRQVWNSGFPPSNTPSRSEDAPAAGGRGRTTGKQCARSALLGNPCRRSHLRGGVVSRAVSR